MPVPIAELFVSVGADISGATSGLNSLRSQLQSAGNQLQSTGRNITQVVTLPIVGAAAAAFKAGADFEHSFTQVRRTVSGLDDTQLQTLRQSLLDMSKTSAGGLKTASELAEIASVGGQVGIAGDEIKDFTSLVARLSLATNLPFDAISEDIGRAINVMGLGSKDFEAFGSVITDLGNKFGGTERDIFEFSRRLGGTLTALGVKPQQIEAIGAALSAAAILPEAGATAVNQFFVDMVNALNETGGASEEAKQKIQALKDTISDLSGNLEIAQLRQKEFGRNTPASVVRANEIAIDKYQRSLGEANTKLANFSGSSADAKLNIAGMAKVAGVSNDEFSNLVRTDPARAFAGFVGGLRDIQKSQGPAGVTKTLEDLGITGDRQRETLLGLANAQQDLTSALDIGDSAWKDATALNKELGTAMEDPINKMTLAANVIQTNLIGVFDKQKESIQNLIDTVNNDLIPAFERIAGAIPTFTPDQIKMFGAIAAIGPGLVALGAVISVVGAAVGLLANPVALVVIGALAGLAVTFDQIANHWEQTKAIFEKVPILAGVAVIIDFFKKNGDEIKATLSGIITAVQGWDVKLTGVVSAALLGVGAIFSAFGTFLSTFFDTVILPILTRFGAWIQEHILGAFIGLLEFLRDRGISTLPGGGDIGTTIDQLKANQTAAGAAAGGAAGGGNSATVTINNPQVTSQALLDQLTAQVSAAVTNALVSAEQAVDPPPPLRLPGQPFFLTGGPF